jgi:hypothetical protein
MNRISYPNAAVLICQALSYCSHHFKGFNRQRYAGHTPDSEVVLKIKRSWIYVKYLGGHQRATQSREEAVADRAKQSQSEGLQPSAPSHLSFLSTTTIPLRSCIASFNVLPVEPSSWISLLPSYPGAGLRAIHSEMGIELRVPCYLPRSSSTVASVTFKLNSSRCRIVCPYMRPHEPKGSTVTARCVDPAAGRLSDLRNVNRTKTGSWTSLRQVT